MGKAVIGVDIGTSSSKGVLVDLTGQVLATAVREHHVSRPQPGWVEMGAEVWWEEFCDISRELVGVGDWQVAAVGVSGMGPCTVVTDSTGTPLRPAILYGVDTRATEQIAALTEQLGAERMLERCGSILTSQAVGPKLAWLEVHEPEIFVRAERLFMPSSWLVWRLCGRYAMDHQSASQCTPLYDSVNECWYEPWVEMIAPHLELPPLLWANDVAGVVDRAAESATGLRAGIPVITGTIDAWTEAVSVDAQNPGDLMLTYGTTMFLIATTKQRITVPTLWGTVGAFAGTRNLAGGMATSGAITGWLRELFGGPSFPTLINEAAASGPGAHGLLMLPYFAGERTPILDPDARGAVLGLTLAHTRGDLYRAALEATALGVRHNIESMRTTGVEIGRVVAAGGGTQGSLWTQIVSDVTGLQQVIPTVTIGASYGAAYLAASAIANVQIAEWNPPRAIQAPEGANREDYEDLYRLYRDLYSATSDIAHTLAHRERRLAASLASTGDAALVSGGRETSLEEAGSS